MKPIPPSSTPLFDPQIRREPMLGRSGSWIVCQIGAREHYAVPRALHRKGLLAELITDFWVPPGHAFGAIPGGRRLVDRFHPDLVHAHSWAPSVRMLAFEAWQRFRKRGGWPVIMARNAEFQKAAIDRIQREFPTSAEEQPMTLFSYSYAALELFKYAKSRGWRTVLGQIDPGLEEERIVIEEHRRYPGISSSWAPTPPAYWEGWRQEVALADKIVVNSEWSLECLLKENIPAGKMQVIPLVYDEKPRPSLVSELKSGERPPSLRVLFLGQINLRKGIGRLLDAMRLLADEPIELTMAGPTDIDPKAWESLPNVRWVGSVPRSEVGRFYRESDVFILPTLSDGYALTQLEALAGGVPVISSNHCGQAVTPGVNGWILEDLEPETIARQLAECARARDESADFGFGKNPAPAAFNLKFLAEALVADLPPKGPVTAS